MDATTRTGLRQRLRDIVAGTVDAAGCELVAIEVTGDNRGTIVRLFIDKAGGVNIDDCARISRAVSPELDVEDPIPGEYRLEVSSPGMDRPVETVADFKRFIGYAAKIRMLPGAERRRYTGELVSADANTVRIVVDGNEHELLFSQIERARLMLDLDQFNEIRARSAIRPDDNTTPIQGDRP
jgi:ribosome maturation factor RimP